MIREANKRMIILRKLLPFDIPRKDLLHIYILYIRPIVEQSCVVWGSSITEDESNSLERTQKCALRLIFQSEYISYSNSLSISGLTSLKERRTKLMQVFAERCVKNEKTSGMFPRNEPTQNTRRPELFQVPFASHERLKSSAIPTMARYLNIKYS